MSIEKVTSSEKFGAFAKSKIKEVIFGLQTGILLSVVINSNVPGLISKSWLEISKKIFVAASIFTLALFVILLGTIMFWVPSFAVLETNVIG